MAAVNAGIKEVYLTSANDITGVGDSDLIGLGFRQNGALTGENFNPIEDNKTRQFPNLFNFKAEFNTMQISANLLKLLLDSSKTSSISSVILTSGIKKTGVSPNFVVSPDIGNIFKFTKPSSDYRLGLDWEFKLSSTERQVNITLERAFAFSDATTILNNSTSNTLTFANDKLPMLDSSSVSSGFLKPTFLGSGGLVNIPDIQLSDFSISIATESSKNAFNISLVKGLKFECEATISSADNNIFYDWVNSSMLPTTDIVFTYTTGKTITIKQLSYSRTNKFEVGDENRTATLRLQGMLDLDFYTENSGNIVFNTYLT